ncbi:MAG: 2Fe-2S iron-sulfur cluster-binding protein [Lautropia sp.]
MTSIPLRLAVNGLDVQAEADPRTLLGDFLRDDLRLTGLHLACEHGVCGGCNVMVNGQVTRACTRLAVQCDGDRVRTIEGFDDDDLMSRLRAAFSREHALQCGYCTPGMLVTAHDIVRRFPGADEATVRRELAGNLCRCTGYAGIVKAIMQVAAEKVEWQDVASADLAAGRPAGRSKSAVSQSAVSSADAVADANAGLHGAAATTTDAAAAGGKPIPDPTAMPDGDAVNRIERSFTLTAPRERVWALFRDTAVVAACMPGLRVDEVQGDQRLRGEFTVRAGPIRAVFATVAKVLRDDAAWSGSVASEGRDRFTKSLVLARLTFALVPASGADATDIRIAAAFHMTGRLAELSRPEIVAALASQLTDQFARNVARRLDPAQQSSSAQTPAAAPLQLSLTTALRAWWQALSGSLRQRIRSIFSRH